jgi:DNA-binding Xre family transcriptional regulator
MKYILNTTKLNIARVAKGLSLRELSRQAGVGLSTTWKGCKCGDVGLRSMRLICEALGLELRDTLVNERTGRPWSAIEEGVR